MASGGRWGVLDYVVIFAVRPLLAVIFVVSLIILGWALAWKLVLVHVPMVQEICGLRKKPMKPKPASRHRLSRFYNSTNAIRNKKIVEENKS